MSIDSARDKLVDEFSSVLSEAESLLDKASKETGDRARDLRSPMEQRPELGATEDTAEGAEIK